VAAPTDPPAADLPPGPDPAAATALDAPARARRRRALAALLAVCALALAVTALVARDDGPGRPPGAWTMRPYQGLGAWVDVYDWTEALGGPDPAVGEAEIDAMAEAGVQTVFLQTAHHRVPGTVAEPERLEGLIDRAHDRGLHVVAWYLPTLVDLDADLDRLLASAALDVDGLGVDIESVEVADPAERTARVLELTERLRAEVGDRPLSAITLTAVHLDVVNPDFWPGYPWAELGRAYDVIQPMTYWSLRRGELRSGERYVDENLARIRALVGDGVPVHPIGGIADEVTEDDLDGMLAAVARHGAIGGGLYDWATAEPAHWERLGPLRALRPAAP